MSADELQSAVKEYVVKNRPHGREKLAVGAGVSARLIAEIINKKHMPKEDNATAIAEYLTSERTKAKAG